MRLQIKIILFCCLFICNLGNVLAQNQGGSRLDSLLGALSQQQEDSNKVKILCEVSSMFSVMSAKDGITYGKTALELANRLNWEKGQAKAYNSIGANYLALGDHDKAKTCFNQALIISEKTGDKKSVAAINGNIGGIYYNQANYPQALSYFLKSLQMQEALGNKNGIALITGNIGNVYFAQNDHANAMRYYLKALQLYREKGDTKGIARLTGSIGILYFYRESCDTALEYFNEAYKLYDKLGDVQGLANVTGDIGMAYAKKKDFSQAIAWCMKEKEMEVQTGNKLEEAMALAHIGYAYLGLADDTPQKHHGLYTGETKKGNFLIDKNIPSGKKEQLALAVSYLKESKDSAIKLKALNLVRDNYDDLVKAYQLLGDYKNALLCEQNKAAIKDSIFSDENEKKLVEAQLKYEYDKKEAIAKVQQEAQLKTESNKMYASIIIAVLLLVVVLVIMKNSRDQKKANDLLQKEKDQISLLKNEIEEKHGEIVDSVNYSRRIQNAILPAVSEIKMALPGSFVFYQPRNIVSGDFYWFSNKHKKIIIAVADCTGHGVPGAFMSMIGNTLLNEIVNEKGIVEPAEILLQLDMAISMALRQNVEGSASNDGMDVAIIAIDKAAMEITFAGANRPLYFIGQVTVNEPLLTEYKANKFAIGGNDKEVKKQFEQQIIPYSTGDQLYLSTDGYADQFGGENGKKMMTTKFKDLLKNICHLPADQQETTLKDRFFAWKGTLEQVDDVLVFGVKL